MQYRDCSLFEFNSALASGAPAPGGGGAAALAAALGAALGLMVGELTVGKKKYAAVEDRMRRLMADMELLRLRALELIDEDARAFEPLAQAYAIPGDDPSRDRIMEDCLNVALSVPMEVLRLSCRGIELMGGFAEMGSTLAISDAGCGTALCKAAMETAALNVYVNTRLLSDRDRADELNAEVKTLTAKYGVISDKIYNSVLRRLT